MDIKKYSMKANNKPVVHIGIVISLIALIMASCKKTENFEKVRLFRPVVKDALLSEGNWIKASWQPIADAESYTAELSQDTFRTILTRVTLDTNVTVFENLGWDKLYQVQVRANAVDTSFSSRMSNLGSIKTARFPSILNIPGINDVTDEAVKITWTTGGAPVSSIKILNWADSSEVTTVDLTPIDITNQYKIISGLGSSGNYIVYLYSDASIRGWADFSTLAPFTGTLVDLRSISGVPSVLADTIPDVVSGTTVILKRGETYNISSTLNLNKSITFISGPDLMVPDPAIVIMASNFNIVSGSVIDSIVFNNVVLIGTDFTAKYVFNINQACTIGKISFISCKAEIFRGVVRTQSQPAIIGKLIMDNCIVDSVRDYAVFNIDVATSRADEIIIRNSTIYKAEKIVASKNNSTSVTIENCTINEAPRGGNYYIDYNAMNVTNGITINNCIFGVGKDNAGNVSIRGIRADAATTINASNNYRTSDQISLGNDIPGIVTYQKTVLQLFQNPATGNYKIIDTDFPGKSNTGDPRWRL
jgi:hypothetical protein